MSIIIRLTNMKMVFSPSSILCRSVHRFNREFPKYDIAVIGGGIVGVASARELLKRHPGYKIVILEKERGLARHQSGSNSGVVHAGIYYKPGSLKAKLCVEGMKLAYEYFDKHKIPYKKCGKLIVATKFEEIERLEDLYQRGLQNGVKDLQMVDSEKIQEIEPYCMGLKALWSPHTGIVDWADVTKSFAADFQKFGGTVITGFEVDSFEESRTETDYPVMICTKERVAIKAKHVLACCGLQSDIVAMKSGCSPYPKIIPFRGEFLKILEHRQYLVKGNIYPVPDPRFPFLGVHFTPRMDGSVLLGPNAVLALKREGYSWSDISLKDIYSTLTYSGFRKMAAKYAGFGFKEMLRSFIIPLQVWQLRRYLPIVAFDVTRGPTGVRAQAMDVDGTLIEDFVFDVHPGKGTIQSRILHCRNAPSPGATSSLAIAKMIADKMQEEFKL